MLEDNSHTNLVNIYIIYNERKNIEFGHIFFFKAKTNKQGVCFFK